MVIFFDRDAQIGQKDRKGRALPFKWRNLWSIFSIGTLDSVFIEKNDHRAGLLPRKRHPHHGDRARARAAHHALSRARPRAESHHGEHTCLAMSGPERPSKRTAPLGYPSGAAGIKLAASLPNSMNQHRGISRRRTVSRCKSTKPYLITRTRRTPSISHSLLMMSSVTETSRSSMV